MNFSIIFWNIWLERNQIGGKAKASRLYAALDNLIKTYDPDCIGLNEVLRRHDEKLPFILEHLKRNGYKHVSFLASGKWTDDIDFGDAIASRYPLRSVHGIVLGTHFMQGGKVDSAHRAQALHATVELAKGRSIDVVVAHLVHMRKKARPFHFEHQTSLSKFVASFPTSKNLIIGGDFNEPTLMPHSFRAKNKRYLHAKTGTFLRPTWFKHAKDGALLRANPDKLFWAKAGSINLTKFTVIPSTASDHRPVYGEFQLEKR